MKIGIKRFNDEYISNEKKFSVLAFDLGNSRLKCSYFEDSCMKHYGAFRLEEIFVNSKFDSNLLDKWLKENKIDNKVKCFISSVNLTIEKHLLSFLNERLFSAKVIEPRDLVGIIGIEYDIDMIGIDRLLHSIGASLFYGEGVCVVDMGTAITVDLTKENVYKGGFIMPGIDMICKSINLFLPHLPMADITINHTNVPSRNTNDALNNGIFYSIVFGLEGIIRSWHEKFGDFTTVLTGGSARFFESELSWPYFPHLTLWGIYRYAEYKESLNEKSS
ncbi:putative transcriptional acitvator, Baf family [Thermodesulfobium narugense DSM 14796]|uniref:Type III pantothenate kinase n=1 Tax=Thermodesulfobium narugense DSM 14796 TaxID=747365 RepID=M1E4A6_9BACT|nr:type III pantothenate kinase [Thermodesulfobium narugense]AEE13907.1 putative transcriptional acitvator, Baf family [Thermodesulfobium narugense DSM 14796]